MPIETAAASMIGADRTGVLHAIAYWFPLYWAIVLLVAALGLLVAVFAELARLVRLWRREAVLVPTRFPVLFAACLALLVAVHTTP